MADDAKIPVLASVRAAWAFFAGNWPRFIPSAALAALGAFVFFQGLAAGTPGPVLVGVAAGLLPAIAYRAALFRFALRGEFGGMFGLKLGPDEGRLAAVTAMYSLFLFLIGLTAFACMSVVVAGLVAAGGDPAAVEAAVGDTEAAFASLGAAGQTGMIVGMFLIFCLLAFVWARLVLAGAATVAEGRIVFLQSWPWTKGQVIPLLAASFLTALPGFLAQWVLGALAVAASGAGLGPVAAFLSLTGALAGTLIGGMMGAGLMVYLYRGLRPPGDAPPQA